MADAAVVWSPASGSIAGTTIMAGDLVGLSNPPTIGEINSCTSLNQVIALYNRRNAQCLQTPLTSFGYQGNAIFRYSAGSVNFLQFLINELRVSVGLPAFDFGTGVAAGKTMSAQHLIDLRTAIDFPGVSKHDATGRWQRDRVDDPYGTQLSETSGAPSVSFLSGQAFVGVPSHFHRFRVGLSFLAFDNLNAAVQAKLVLQRNGGSGTTNQVLYSSDSDDQAGASGWWNNLDNFIANVTPLFPAQTDIPLTLADISPAGLANVSFILGTSTEIAGTNDSDNACTFSTAYPADFYLEVDLGF